MTNSEKPQPMEVDQKKPEEKTEEKQELVSLFFVESLFVILQFSLTRSLISLSIINFYDDQKCYPLIQ
jgi:hypothetical protein